MSGAFLSDCDVFARVEPARTLFAARAPTKKGGVERKRVRRLAEADAARFLQSVQTRTFGRSSPCPFLFARSHSKDDDHAMATVDALTAHTNSPLDLRPRTETGARPAPSAVDGVGLSRPIEAKHPGRRILVCLDRSTLSEVCVPHAVSLAKTFGSAMTLAHIMQPQHENGAPQTNDALGWEISRQEAQAYLERLQKDVLQSLGKPVDIRLEQGRPADRIIDLAHEVSADLIVIGSRGEGGAGPHALGSTVLQVLEAVRTSLFVAHACLSAPVEAAPRHILVPLDGSPRSESVLPAAVRIASSHGAELLLVHVVQEPLPTALLPAAEDMALAQRLAGLLESGATRYLDLLRKQLAYEVTSVRTLVLRHASAPQCLLDVSVKEKADLIVLSAHGSACDSSRSFGSVTACLLTHAAVPLLTLQDLPEAQLHSAEGTEATRASPSLRASYAVESV